MAKVPVAHQIYRRVRPFLYDWGVLRMLRRSIGQQRRTQLAAQLGLSGFDPASAPGHSLLATRSNGERLMGASGVNYVADLRADLGISEHSRLMIAAIRTAGIPVAYTEVAYRFASRSQPLPEGLSTGAPYAVSIIDQNFGQIADALLDLPPEAYRERYRIGLWAWELDEFPSKWHRAFDYVDEVWVASRFTQDALALVSPVPVVRMPFPMKIEPSKTASRQVFGLPNDTTLFLFTFSAASTAARKNPFGVIDAFERAFGQNSSEALLIIKAHHLNLPDAASLAQPLAEAVERIGGRLIVEHLDRQTTYDLTAVCDIYVSLHRAEGFGLGIAEALSLGKPVIATAYSGNVDFVTESTAFPVRCTIRDITEDDHRYQPLLRHLYEPGLHWAEPDLDHAAELMRFVHEHPDTARARGIAGRTFMTSHYHPDQIGSRIAARLSVCTRVSNSPTAAN